jgi:enoyl-CoA hydratase/carnithine racemase
VSDRVVVTVSDHVAEVMLNRPDKYNALDLEMFRGIEDALQRLHQDSGIRAVVLHGAGDNFCAGIDLEVLKHGGEAAMTTLLSPVGETGATLAQWVAYGWRTLPMPVICALRGIAYGGGFQVAMGADLRYAAPDTRMSIMEARWGLIPDMAISATMRHVAPPDRIKELAFSAEVFDADEGLRLGAITRLEEEPLEAARRMAAAIAGMSPDAIRGIKRLVNDAWTASEAGGLALEARIQAELLRAPNQAEAVRAGLEKRQANFED